MSEALSTEQAEFIVLRNIIGWSSLMEIKSEDIYKEELGEGGQNLLLSYVGIDRGFLSAEEIDKISRIAERINNTIRRRMRKLSPLPPLPSKEEGI